MSVTGKMATIIDSKEIQKYHQKAKGAKSLEEWRQIWVELQKKYNLTESQTLDILHGVTTETFLVSKYKSNDFLSLSIAPSNELESQAYATALAEGNYPAGLDGCFCLA